MAAVRKEPRATIGEPTWYPSPANPSLTPQNPKCSAGEPAELSDSCTVQLRPPKGPARCARGRGSPSKLRRPHPAVFQSDSGSPKHAAASRRSLVLTERRPSTPESLGPSPSRAKTPLPASRPRFSRPQNRSRHPMDSSPVLWITKPPSGAESDVGKPMPHSPSVELQVPDPKTENRYPRNNNASPASRSSRAIRSKVEALPKEETLSPASWPQRFYSSSTRSRPEGRAQAAAWQADYPREGRAHAPCSTLIIQRMEHDIRRNQHSPTGNHPNQQQAVGVRGPGQARNPEGLASRRFESASSVRRAEPVNAYSRTRSRQGPYTLCRAGEPVDTEQPAVASIPASWSGCYPLPPRSRCPKPEPPPANWVWHVLCRIASSHAGEPANESTTRRQRVAIGRKSASQRSGMSESCPGPPPASWGGMNSRRPHTRRTKRAAATNGRRPRRHGLHRSSQQAGKNGGCPRPDPAPSKLGYEICLDNGVSFVRRATKHSSGDSIPHPEALRCRTSRQQRASGLSSTSASRRRVPARMTSPSPDRALSPASWRRHTVAENPAQPPANRILSRHPDGIGVSIREIGVSRPWIRVPGNWPYAVWQARLHTTFPGGSRSGKPEREDTFANEVARPA